LSDAIDRGQADPKALVHRKIHTCDTCHDFSCSLEEQRDNPLLQKLGKTTGLLQVRVCKYKP
jgi:hypothetical protein